ncbi:MAG: YicC family protein [Treponema sp.]|nr:YicC family protein [Treponema sp.]
MISMTGYAYSEIESAANLRLGGAGAAETADKNNKFDISVSVEIKGCNNRFLEININLPPWLSMFESKIKKIISSSCGRGKVDVFIRVREHNAPVKVNINKNAVRAYFDALKDIAEDLGINENPNLDTLIEMESVLEIEKYRENGVYWDIIEPVLRETAEKFQCEREREGKHTENDILLNLEIIESSLKNVSSLAPVIEQTLKDNIRTRFSELLGSQIDENRILSETASLLIKYTISEEISRLSSHLSEFRNETNVNPRPGKKCDFLCQELNREINTIGSKSAILEISAEVVKMKEALENIREQLRNIE